MKKIVLIPALIVSTAIALPAAPAPAHAAITPAQIAAAVTAAGMKISPEQVTLLTDVVATTASPRLDVESIEPWGDQRMRVRLSCAASEQCLPFIVAVRLSKPDAAQLDNAASDHLLAKASRTATDPTNFAVRAGAQATLLLDGGHVHIRLIVVCLENGAAGQTIRVSSLDHRQSYRAKVVGEAVLRASL
jgi:hypothetical protein